MKQDEINRILETLAAEIDDNTEGIAEEYDRDVRWLIWLYGTFRDDIASAVGRYKFMLVHRQNANDRERIEAANTLATEIFNVLASSPDVPALEAAAAMIGDADDAA